MEKHAVLTNLHALLTKLHAFGLALALVAACGQEAPPPPPDELEPYHPLVDGAWWEYEHTNWTERVTLTAATFNGEPAFTMIDSPNPSDGLLSESIIVSLGGRVSRMTKDEYLGAGTDRVLRSSVEYGVGFTRFNEGWAEQAVGFKESPNYVRVETPPSGVPKPGEDRRHTFEVVSLSDTVMTGAGPFDCIAIKRTKDWQAAADGVDLADAQTKTFWFARGVGKVQEKNEETGSTEVLTAFDIPSAVN